MKFNLELTDEQLRAIGHVAAQWAFMENLIDSIYGDIAIKRLGNDTLKGSELSFVKRLRRYISTMDKNNPKELKSIEILTKIGEISEKRMQIIHGQWGTTGEPLRLELFGARMKRYYQQEMTIEKIEKVAQQISELSASIIKLFFPVPSSFFHGGID